MLCAICFLCLLLFKAPFLGMDETEIHQIALRVLQGGFFAPPGVSLRLSYDLCRSVAWEMLGGHLLDAAQTRLRQTFASWEVSLHLADDSAGPQPLLALFWDEPRAAFHVIRYLRVHGWEPYEAQPNAILSRPVEKQACELVGTIPVSEGPAAADVCRRLERLVFRALAGSRLPVTSWESPLPAFQLGQCGYLPGTSVGNSLCELPTDSRSESATLSPGSEAPGDALECGQTGEAAIETINSSDEILRRSLAVALPRLRSRVSVAGTWNVACGPSQGAGNGTANVGGQRGA